MLGYRIPKTWRRSDLSLAMWHAASVTDGEKLYAILQDYDRLLLFGLDYVRRNCGFNVDYSKFSTDN